MGGLLPSDRSESSYEMAFQPCVLPLYHTGGLDAPASSVNAEEEAVMVEFSFNKSGTPVRPLLL